MKNYRVFFAFWVLGTVGRASMIVQSESPEEAQETVERDLKASKTFGGSSPLVYEVREATLNDLDEFADAD